MMRGLVHYLMLATVVACSGTGSGGGNSPAQTGGAPNGNGGGGAGNALGGAGSGNTSPGGANGGGRDGGPPRVCIPGASLACACTNGMSGAQTCNARGTALDPCACGAGGAPGSGDAGQDAGHECIDLFSDPWNCGACGVQCPNKVSGCVLGSCGRWTDCVDAGLITPTPTCDDICAKAGKTCVFRGCLGHSLVSNGNFYYTALEVSSQTSCGADVGDGSVVPCSDPLSLINYNDKASCCCAN